MSNSKYADTVGFPSLMEYPPVTHIETGPIPTALDFFDFSPKYLFLGDDRAMFRRIKFDSAEDLWIKKDGMKISKRIQPGDSDRFISWNKKEWIELKAGKHVNFQVENVETRHRLRVLCIGPSCFMSYTVMPGKKKSELTIIFNVRYELGWKFCPYSSVTILGRNREENGYALTMGRHVFHVSKRVGLQSVGSLQSDFLNGWRMILNNAFEYSNIPISNSITSYLMSDTNTLMDQAQSQQSEVTTSVPPENVFDFSRVSVVNWPSESGGAAVPYGVFKLTHQELQSLTDQTRAAPSSSPVSRTVRRSPRIAAIVQKYSG